MLRCRACGRHFDSQALLRAHYRVHKNISNKFVCPRCAKTFSKMAFLGRHIDSQHDGVVNVEEERVGPPVFPDQLMTDNDREKMQEKFTAIAYDLFTHEPDALRKYTECGGTIFDHRIVGSHSRRVADCCVVKTFNMALTPCDPKDSAAIRAEIVQKFEHLIVPLMNYQYKLAVEIGGILNHMDDDGEVERTEYCYPSVNTSLILPDIITNNRLLVIERRDNAASQLQEALAHRELSEAITRGAAREDTKTVLVFFTNVIFKVFKMVDVFVGSEEDDFIKSESVPVTENVVPVIPEYIKRMKSLNNHRSANKDCVWRMLLSRLPKKHSTKQLAEEFVAYRAKLGITKPTADEFLQKGVNIFDRVSLKEQKKKWFTQWKCNVEDIVSQLEHCFDININLYYLDKDNLDYIESKGQDLHSHSISDYLCLRAAHISCGQHGKRTKNATRLNALVGRCSENESDFHVYEIVKIDNFVSQYRCSFCRMTFRRQSSMKKHMSSKSCLSRYRYKGGVHQRTKNVWETLDELNIDYSDVDTTCNKRVTWDIEAKAVDMESPKTTSKTAIRKKHIPVSIALRSNISSYDQETYYRYSENPKELFTWFYDLLKKMQEKAEALWHGRMETVYAKLEQRIIELGGVVKIPERRWNNMSDNLREQLKGNASTKFQESLYKHSPRVDIQLKEAQWPMSQRVAPLTNIKPLMNDQTIFDVLGLEAHMPSNYLLEETDDEESEIDDLDEYMDGGHADEEVDGDLDKRGEKAVPKRKKKKKGSVLESYIKKLKSCLTQLKSYGSVLPVIGYNSGQYDLGCFAEIWPSIFGLVDDCESNDDEDNDIQNFIEHENEDGFIVKKKDKTKQTHRCKVDKVLFKPNIIGKSKVYKQITTKHGLKFLDLINYVPAKTSLDSLVKSYKLPDVKGFFPYSTLARNGFPSLKMELNSTTYDLFEDDLKQPPHRVQGHLLESDWQNYTADLFRNSTQPVIYNIAVHLAKKSMFEEQEASSTLNFKTEFLKKKNNWLSLLGFNSIAIQKPRTCDAEDILSLRPSYSETFDDTIQRRTHFHWLNETEGKKSEVKTSVKQLTTREIVTGIENLHKHVINVWTEKNISTMHEYLAWYNKKDVEIMHPLIDAMQANYKNIDSSCQLFVDNMSLPNIARYIGYKNCEKAGGVFFLAKGDDEGLAFERVIRRNLNGGPSIIFNRGVTANITKIEGTENIVQIVKTYDANALYPKCMQSWLPVGNNVHVYKPNDEGVWCHSELGKSKDSFLENVWIDHMNKDLLCIARRERNEYLSRGCVDTYPDVEILSQKRTGQVPRVGHYEVDGIRYRSQFTDAELRKFGPHVKGIVYEFLGDYYHGHPSMIKNYQKQEKDDMVKLMKTRYTETHKKFCTLLEFGYVVNYIWESEFKTKNKDVYDCGQYIPPFTTSYVFAKGDEKKRELMRQISDPKKFQDLLSLRFDERKVVLDNDCANNEDIPNIHFFGMAEVDLDSSELNKDLLDKFPPLFVKGTLKDETNAQLRGVLRCEKALLTTPYLQCLISVGYKITKVYQAWEFRAAKCLKPFIDQVVYERRKGDVPGGNPLQANTYKLIGNSFYGGSVMNKDGHSDISYCSNLFEVCRQINKPNFCDAHQINDNLVELHTTRQKIDQNIPIQVGKFVLDAAKIHMVNFYYYIIRGYCDMRKIDLISMDTDSFTLALAAKDIHSCVLPEKKEEWENTVRPVWFSHQPCDTKTFCNLQSHCNKRTPGPFKEEFSGEKAIGLSSKLFTVTSLKPGGSTKTASKGLKQKNMFSDCSELFEKTLVDDEPMTVMYTSLQRQSDTMTTVDNSRSVSRKYSKRKVNDDDVTRTTSIRDTVYCGTPRKRRRLNELKKQLRNEIKNAQRNLDFE